jgi:acetyl-CoA carboxylase biotin carboxyl carrier protein
MDQTITLAPNMGLASSGLPSPPVGFAPAQEGSNVQPTPEASEPNVIVVKSPIVGTYYDSPSPGAASFVRVGEQVEPGKVLCIIESMKLMNEIEAEVAGSIVAKLVENGKPVEYGESLFTIQPR